MNDQQKQELEQAIAEINNLRSRAQATGQIRSSVNWKVDWSKAHQRAAICLGVPWASGHSWNQVIDDLDDYRADWRGYEVPVKGRLIKS